MTDLHDLGRSVGLDWGQYTLGQQTAILNAMSASYGQGWNVGYNNAFIHTLDHLGDKA